MNGKIRIDLNSDVGESYGVYKLGLDEEVIPHITSANIACGFHAGDPGTMRRTVSLARAAGVEVGAHPGFPDLLGFGRRNMDASLAEVQDYVVYQMGALMAVAQSFGMKLQHVKTHGSLYNMSAADSKLMTAIAEAVGRVNLETILVVPAPSETAPFLEIGKRCGIRIAFEVFADRAYNPDGSLVSRRISGALIEDHGRVAERAVRMALERTVTAIDGTELAVPADTICVHGDNPGAVAMVREIRERLVRAGVEVTAMKNFIRG
jgi:5-oxoprolinase (ATP-hydrolysing) subunit A